ncbi:hypothetical protein WDW37_17305 [Bdellovibrionota bacterium FG-1]
MLRGSIILLVTAFHHVSSANARDFLERSARAGASVLVVEPLDRNLKGIVLGGLLFLPALLFPIRTLLRSWPGLGRWMRLAAFHWVIPLIPFFLSHDGIVSARRQRTSDDWDALIHGLPYELIIRPNLGLMRNFSVVLLKMSEKSQ